MSWDSSRQEGLQRWRRRIDEAIAVKKLTIHRLGAATGVTVVVDSRIVVEKFSKRVSKMHLYYTRTEGESPYVTWDFDSRRVTGTLKKFEETVAKIEGRRFSNAKVVKCARLCDGCDMRFYCNYK